MASCCRVANKREKDKTAGRAHTTLLANLCHPRLHRHVDLVYLVLVELLVARSTYAAGCFHQGGHRVLKLPNTLRPRCSLHPGLECVFSLETDAGQSRSLHDSDDNNGAPVGQASWE